MVDLEEADTRNTPTTTGLFAMPNTSVDLLLGGDRLPRLLLLELVHDELDDLSLDAVLGMMSIHLGHGGLEVLHAHLVTHVQGDLQDLLIEGSPGVLEEELDHPLHTFSGLHGLRVVGLEDDMHEGISILILSDEGLDSWVGEEVVAAEGVLVDLGLVHEAVGQGVDVALLDGVHWLEGGDVIDHHEARCQGYSLSLVLTDLAATDALLGTLELLEHVTREDHLTSIGLGCLGDEGHPGMLDVEDPAVVTPGIIHAVGLDTEEG